MRTKTVLTLATTAALFVGFSVQGALAQLAPRAAAPAAKPAIAAPAAAAHVPRPVAKDVIEAARRQQDAAFARELTERKLRLEKSVPEVKSELNANEKSWRAAAVSAGLDEKAYEADVKAFAAAKSDAERVAAFSKLTSYRPILSKIQTTDLRPDVANRIAAAANLPSAPPSEPKTLHLSDPNVGSQSFVPPFTVWSTTSASSWAYEDGRIRTDAGSALLSSNGNRASYTFVAEVPSPTTDITIEVTASNGWETQAATFLGYASSMARLGITADTTGPNYVGADHVQRGHCEATRGGETTAIGIDNQDRRGHYGSDPTLTCDFKRDPGYSGTRVTISVFVEASGTAIGPGGSWAESVAKIDRVRVLAR